MIPNLQPRVIGNLTEWLVSELRQARSDRADLEQDWIEYQRLYRARPKNKTRDFPFRGAANIVIPVIGSDVDTTVAGILGTIFATPNLWSCEALRPDRMEFAARLEEFLEWAQETELGMYSTICDWVTEICKLGTGVLKQRYIREQKQVLEWRESQGPGQPQVLQQMVRRLVKDRPDVGWTQLSNFYAPATARSIEDSPWVAERISLTWTQLENRVRAGIYSADFLAKIGAHWRATQPKSQYAAYESAQEKLDNFLPSINSKFELFEFWTNYDIQAIGEPNAVVCTIHEPTMAYARADFNPFFHQEYPYSDARFIRVEGRFYGIGLCEILKSPQDVISTLECQRLDNGTIRNTVLLKARRGSGVKADEPIWPGRIFLVDNPADDLVPMQMGYEAQSTLQEEQNMMNYASRRSGVSAWQQGGAGTPAISYSAATTTIEMLKQGKLRLDQTIREIQQGLTQTGQRTVELYQQYNQAGKAYQVMGDKDGAVMQQVLTFPLDTIRLGVAIKVTATNSQLNKETKIRTDQIIFGLVMQFYQQMFQAMSIVVNPQMPPPLKILMSQMIVGGTVLARRTLDSYGTQNLDQIIPDLEALSALSTQLGGGQPGSAGPGLPPGGPVSTVPPPGPGRAGVGGGPGQPPWLGLGAGGPGGAAGGSVPTAAG